jgi:hypothetical protein
MRPVLLASVSWLTLALAAPAQVKIPKPPDSYDVTIRYRIEADRNERVLQFEAMNKFFAQLGFKQTESDENDLGAFDPTAEVMTGTVPSKTARDLLKDRRVQTMILAPAGYKPPADPQAGVRAVVELNHSLDQLALFNQTEIALRSLGFKADLGFDTRGFTVFRGTVPAGNVGKLTHDLRQQPSGWFAPDQSPDLFAKLPDGTPTPYLVKPFADILPVRVVEVFGPAEAAPAVVTLPPIAADHPYLNKWTADLRRKMAEEASAAKPLRLEVVLANQPPEGDLEWRKPIAGVGAAIEGRVGTVVTVLVPQGSKAADLAALPDVSSVRLPRAAAGTPVEKGEEPKKESPKDDKQLSRARFEADPAKESDVLKATGLDRLHAAGKKGQGVHVVILDTDFAGWEQRLAPPGQGKGVGGVAFIDLTGERNRDVRPDPMPGALGHGTEAARAVRLAAPAADLFLVRIPADAPYQVINVARTVRGEEFRTEGLITRRQEINAEASDLASRRRAARLEYQRAFEDFSDDEKARQRRIAAQQALRKLDTEEAALLGRQIRIEELEKSLARLTGAQVVLNELQWNTGFALDAASPVSRFLDDWLTPRHRAYSRPLTRPTPPAPPLWFQPAGDTRGQTWTGVFRDVDHNGVMEFAPPESELKPGRWSRELNFLASGSSGKYVLDLAAGTRVRISVQWREPHEPTLPESDYRAPIAPLRLQLVKQRDPSGEKYGSDEIDLIAESEGLPARLQIEPTYGVYEHSLEVALPAAGRYAVRIEGRVPDNVRPYGSPTLAAQETDWELRPRLFVESLGGKGRLTLADYSSEAGGVAVPADARSVLAVGAAGPDGKIRPFTATGVGPLTELHHKPDWIAPDTLPGLGDGPARGSDLAVAFAAGWAATLQSAGLKAANFYQLRIPPGGMIAVPEGWFHK